MPALKSNETMDHLAERVRALVGGDPRVTEKNMFGGLTFLLNGRILAGTKKDGRILLSVGKEHNDDALGRPGATQMMHRDKPMRGFVWIEPDAIEDDDDLRGWVDAAVRWVSQLPDDKPRPARKPPAKKAAPARPAAKKAAGRKAAT